MSSPGQVLILLLGCITPIQALVPHTAQWGSALPRASAQREHSVLRAGLSSSSDELLSRRQTLIALSTVSVSAAASSSQPRVARAEDASMYAPKFVQQYDDFVTSPEGFSYRDVTVGKGEAAKPGDRVVFDWSGYTIGYFGRPFQAKGGPQGGAFDKEIDYARTVIGSGTMVEGLEGGLVGLQPGGVRQIVVPFGPLSYPAGDMAHDKVGPKPSTFSGDRALNFVLENPRVDRTLLFNVKVIRIDSPNGKGGFNRG